ncbi:hypothetical protein BaRGS_00013350, partial [Batillaria attramentaria]
QQMESKTKKDVQKEFDRALLIEVAAINPFHLGNMKKGSGWREVADKLADHLGQPEREEDFKLKERKNGFHVFAEQRKKDGKLQFSQKAEKIRKQAATNIPFQIEKLKQQFQGGPSLDLLIARQFLGAGRREEKKSFSKPDLLPWIPFTHIVADELHLRQPDKLCADKLKRKPEAQKTMPLLWSVALQSKLVREEDFKLKERKNGFHVFAEQRKKDQHVIAKFEALRSSFSRELRKLKESKKSGAGAEDVRKVTWPFFSQMTFLRGSVSLDNYVTSNMTLKVKKKTLFHRLETDLVEGRQGLHCELFKTAAMRRLAFQVACRRGLRGERIFRDRTNPFDTYDDSAEQICHRFPDQHEVPRVIADFYALSRFPNVVGCLDCTHVRILAPSEMEAAYVNHKGHHSMN